MATHLVKKGDTLSSIAKKYGTTVTGIMNCNRTMITDPDSIQVGWVITIPTDDDDRKPSKNYSAIGKQVEKVVADIKKLESFDQLLNIM